MRQLGVFWGSNPQTPARGQAPWTPCRGHLVRFTHLLHSLAFRSSPASGLPAVERPNVALGALDAPNVAFGALDAPNATLGRMGAARERSSARVPGVYAGKDPFAALNAVKEAFTDR
ncbi:hypothetical protein GCM10023192_11390 [Amycolatopsis samaneae]